VLPAHRPDRATAVAGRGGRARLAADEPWAALTHPDQLCEILRAELPGGRAVERCEIFQTAFRTSPADRRAGRPVVALECRLEPGGQLMHIRAYDGHGRRRFERHRASALAYLPATDAVVWAFPADPRLGHLREVIDPASLRRHLPYAALPAGFDGPDDIAGVEVDVLRWKPTKRCVSRYRLAGAPGETELVGKTLQSAGRATAIAQRMDWISAQLDARPDGFTSPRSLGCDEGVRTVWQVALHGTPLMEIVLAGDDTTRLVEQAGRGLAALHAIAPPPGTQVTTPADLLRFAAGGPAQLAGARPDLRVRLEAIVEQLERDAAALGPFDGRVLHGDFLLKQLLVAGDRLAVFDLDDVSVGDATQDVANCLADLHNWGLDAATVHAMTVGFLDAYRAHAEGDVDPLRLRWHYRVQLLLDAWYWHKRRHLEPAFVAELDALLASAEEPLPFA
jgi:phosphotransferase family enzyme